MNLRFGRRGSKRASQQETDFSLQVTREKIFRETESGSLLNHSIIMPVGVFFAQKMVRT
jgi:hypothetical protein